MRIGIIGAMDEEIVKFKEMYKIDEVVKVAALEFYVAKSNNVDIVFVKSGIGKVNASCCAQILITKFEVDMVINVGIAGGLYSELELGDIVVSTKVVQHDFDITFFGNPRGEIEGTGRFFEADKKMVELVEKTFSKDLGIKMYFGTIATGDQFVGDNKHYKFVRDEFDAYAVEMEGAAIGQVCFLNNVPFIIIRSISDTIEGNAEIDYPKFKDSSANNAAAIVAGLLKAL